MPLYVTTGASALKSIAFVLTFLWLSAALGRRIQRQLKVPSQYARPELHLSAVALGAGCLQAIPFLLGVLGCLKQEWLCLAVLVVAVALSVDMSRTLADTYSALRSLSLPTPWSAAWAVALLPGLVTAAALAVAPSTDPDGLWYHLTVPKRWLASGSLHYLPTYPNSNMPMGVEMLFSIALAAVGDTAAKLLHFVLGLCGALSALVAGTRLGNRVVGASAAALYLFGPLGVGGLLGWGFIEGATSFATLAAAMAWLVWREHRDAGWLSCAFLLAGIAVSFKITAGLVPLGLAGLTVAVLWNDRRMSSASTAGVSTAGASIAGASTAGAISPWPPLLLCAIPVLPWLVRAGVQTGNPFFPMFASFIPSRDFAPDLAAQWSHFNRYLNWAIIIGRDWSLELRQAVLMGSAVVLALAALAISLLRRSWLARASTITLLVTALLQLAAVGLYLRYWIPMAAALSIPLLALLQKQLSSRAAQVGIVIATLAMSLGQSYRNVRSANGDFTGVVTTALGVTDQLTFLNRHVPPFPLYEIVNRDLPSDSRILLGLYCGGFYIDRTTYCADIVQGSLRLTTWQDFLADGRRLGVTHVLAPTAIASAEPHPVADASGVGYMVQDKEYELIGRLIIDRGKLLATAGNDGLYAVNLRDD